MKQLFAFLFSIGGYLATAQQPLYMTVEEYISNYSWLAIVEMDRAGIPASIKLGQAIIESQCGNSQLALQSKNHFGIKCKAEWSGATYYQIDDDRDARGNLVPSCFRAYSAVEDSYRDHSEFLSTRERYKMLFSIDRTDYKGWAQGLKAAGYATAEHYATQLVATIEKYHLYQFDRMTSLPLAQHIPTQTPVSGLSPTKQEEITNVTAYETLALPPSNFVAVTAKWFQTELSAVNWSNGVPYIRLRAGETLQDVAIGHRVSLHKLYVYNDLPANASVAADAPIFLKKKKKVNRGAAATHIVTANQSLHDVSQMYGIKLKHLSKYNGLKNAEGALPLGNTVLLSKAK